MTTIGIRNRTDHFFCYQAMEYQLSDWRVEFRSFVFRIKTSVYRSCSIRYRLPSFWEM